MSNWRKLNIGLAVWILSLGAVTNLNAETSWELSDYQVQITNLTPKPGSMWPINSKMEIKKANQIVAELNGANLKLGSRNLDSNQSKFTKPGTDISGNGVPDLVVSEHTGGRDCCLKLHIFELGQKFKPIGKIDARFAPETDFYQLPGDSKIYYRTADYTFGGWGSKDFSNPAPRVVLKFSGERITFHSTEMRRPTPSQADLAALAHSISPDLATTEAAHGGRDLPASLTAAVLNLVYSGNTDSVPKFLELVWPSGRQGREEYWKAIMVQLRQSPYWSELQELLRQQS